MSDAGCVFAPASSVASGSARLETRASAPLCLEALEERESARVFGRGGSPSAEAVIRWPEVRGSADDEGSSGGEGKGEGDAGEGDGTGEGGAPARGSSGGEGDDGDRADGWCQPSFARASSARASGPGASSSARASGPAAGTLGGGARSSFARASSARASGPAAGTFGGGTRSSSARASSARASGPAGTFVCGSRCGLAGAFGSGARSGIEGGGGHPPPLEMRCFGSSLITGAIWASGPAICAAASTPGIMLVRLTSAPRPSPDARAPITARSPSMVICP